MAMMNYYSKIGEWVKESLPIFDKICENKLYTFIMGFTVLFGWEHCFRLREIKYRPTIALNIITKYFSWVFSRIGGFVAHISSFLTLIEFREIKQTFSELFISWFELLTVFLYLIKGYFDESRKYISNRNLIYLGSCLLGICVYYVVQTYAHIIV